MSAKVLRYRIMVVAIMLICCTFPGSLFAQKNYPLIVNYLDSPGVLLQEKAGIRTSFGSKVECDAYIAGLIASLQSKGFISASLDSIFSTAATVNIFLFLGRQYQSLQLTINTADKSYMAAIGNNERKKISTIFSFSDYTALSERLLDYFEESGYPFAKINLDSLHIQDDRIVAALRIDKGYTYHIDSIRMYGSAHISGNFIHRYLNIERGSAYSKKKLDKINQRLLELPYLQQTHPWDVTMLNTGSLVNLYLQPRRSNQVNVLAGFLPANQQLGGKLLFTVDATLRLQNAFGGGETAGIVWQQIQPKSPRINLQFTQPYLFNSPFGVDFVFDLLKKDSAFLNLNAQLGLLYMLSPIQTAKVIIQTRRTNVLDVDTNVVKNTKRLPDVADVSSVNLGIDYDYSNTDYRLNPRRGNEVYISALAGNKNIRKNNTISQLKEAGFDYNALYDTIKLKAYQVRATARAAHYFKAGKQSVVKTGVSAGLYQSPQYFRNELFQVGGYKTLRGFDEESIYADRYAIGTLEYRYLLDLNSNFLAFTDFGWSHNNLVKQSNTYIGTGIGLSFETKGSIFSISYAVGKRNDLNFDLKQSKIHIGYVSLF